MSYYREAEATSSPFFRYMAYFNALEVASEDYNVGMGAWVGANAGRHSYRSGQENPPADVLGYLQNERRHAVAHAVRYAGIDDLNPYDPELRARFHRDSSLLADFVRDRVRERWGDYAMWIRRRSVTY
jgi:hypothetical protein